MNNLSENIMILQELAVEVANYNKKMHEEIKILKANYKVLFYDKSVLEKKYNKQLQQDFYHIFLDFAAENDNVEYRLFLDEKGNLAEYKVQIVDDIEDESIFVLYDDEIDFSKYNILEIKASLSAVAEMNLRYLKDVVKKLDYSFNQYLTKEG